MKEQLFDLIDKQDFVEVFRIISENASKFPDYQTFRDEYIYNYGGYKGTDKLAYRNRLKDFVSKCLHDASTFEINKGNEDWRNSQFEKQKIPFSSIVRAIAIIFACIFVLYISVCIGNTPKICLKILAESGQDVSMYFKVNLYGNKSATFGNCIHSWIADNSILSKKKLKFDINIGGITLSSYIVNLDTVKDIKQLSNLTYTIRDLKDSTSKILHTYACGKDSKNKKACFDIHLIDTDYSWKLNSNEKIVYETTQDSIDLNSFIAQKYKKDIFRMETRKGVICIGNACATTKKEKPDSDYEELAIRRANSLARACSKVFKMPSHYVYALSIGKNNSNEKRSDTEKNDQRTLIIIGILEKEDGTDEKEALYNAMCNLNGLQLPFNFKEFSGVDNTKTTFKNELKPYRTAEKVKR